MSTLAVTDPRAYLTAALKREEEKLLACVHCGFCLDYCPTYRRLGDEADSPRGRIYLMRAVVEGRLAPDDEAFTRHMDLCLECVACQTVCPSGVPYGELIEHAKVVRVQASGMPLITRGLLLAFGSTGMARISNALARLFLATRLPTLLVRFLPRWLGSARFGLAMIEGTRPWRGLRKADAGTRGHGDTANRASETAGLASGAAAPASERKPEVAGIAASPRRRVASSDARAPVKLRVAHLSGCVQEGLYGRVNRATERVLAANGCELVRVPDQQCCGALHGHTGDLEHAAVIARANIEAFEAAGIDRVVSNAGGCGAMMKEYPELLAYDPAWAERARAFRKKVRDVWELLAEIGPVTGGALPLRVTYDAPCHLYHAQGITRAPQDMLRAIPELQLIPLADMEECCGGAGTYGITHPELGDRILGDKIAAIQATGADVVCSSNPGCMMQIGAGLRLARDPMPLLHAIELVDESYRRGGLYS
jgi:glycolate oxidase iron-sulfur subunit